MSDRKQNAEVLIMMFHKLPDKLSGELWTGNRLKTIKQANAQNGPITALNQPSTKSHNSSGADKLSRTVRANQELVPLACTTVRTMSLFSPPSLSRNSTTSLLLAPRSKIKKLNYRLYCSAVLPTPWPVPSAPTSPMLIWPLSCVLH